MFDTVGREIDPERRRRQAWLVAWTTVLAAVGVGASVFLAATVVPVVREDTPDLPERLVELDLDAAPVAPESPAAARISQGAPSSTAAPLPTEPPDAPTLTPNPADEVRSAEPPAGSPDGDPNGDPKGVREGRPGGRGDGEGSGDGGGGIKAISQAALEWKRQPAPDYPRAAQGLGLGEQRCVAKLRLDEEGVPVNVSVAGCLPAFVPETIEALSGWRAYPVRVGSTRIPVQTTVVVHFKER